MTKSKFVSSLVILNILCCDYVYKMHEPSFEATRRYSFFGVNFSAWKKALLQVGGGDLIQGLFWFQVSSPPSTLPDCSERLVERSKALLLYRQTDIKTNKSTSPKCCTNIPVAPAGSFP